MRELKFRAWEAKGKGWRYFDGIFNKQPWIERFESCPELIPMEVMQYTGLHDKNGREIYEGDIVRFIGRAWKKIEVVEWLDGAAGFDPFIDADDNDDACTVPKPDDCEVIGNIYENKELLV